MTIIWANKRNWLPNLHAKHTRNQFELYLLYSLFVVIFFVFYICSLLFLLSFIGESFFFHSTNQFSHKYTDFITIQPSIFVDIFVIVFFEHARLRALATRCESSELATRSINKLCLAIVNVWYFLVRCNMNIPKNIYTTYSMCSCTCTECVPLTTSNAYVSQTTIYIFVK